MIAFPAGVKVWIAMLKREKYGRSAERTVRLADRQVRVKVASFLAVVSVTVAKIFAGHVANKGVAAVGPPECGPRFVAGRIMHGDLDDNAHFQNTVHLISALQKANKQFQLMIYPGGNHSLRGTQNPRTFLHFSTVMTNFLVENL